MIDVKNCTSIYKKYHTTQGYILDHVSVKSEADGVEKKLSDMTYDDFHNSCVSKNGGMSSALHRKFHPDLNKPFPEGYGTAKKFNQLLSEEIERVDSIKKSPPELRGHENDQYNICNNALLPRVAMKNFATKDVNKPEVLDYMHKVDLEREFHAMDSEHVEDRMSSEQIRNKKNICSKIYHKLKVDGYKDMDYGSPEVEVMVMHAQGDLPTYCDLDNIG